MWPELNELSRTGCYWVLFLGLLAESCFLTTFFLPGSLLAIVGGALSARGVLDPGLMGLTALAGVLLGDSLSFWASRWGAAEWPHVARRIHPLRQWLTRPEVRPDRLLASGVFHFTSIGRFVMPLAFGASTIDFRL
jgi:membrane protein DedA with SNARE-associated domain